MRGARAIFRRMIAFVLLVGAFAMNVEAVLPDVHDGDAQQAVSSTPTSDNYAAAGAVLGGPATTSQSPAPLHAAHSEHCAHSHLLIPARSRSLNIANVIFPQAADISIDMPESVTPQLNQRPPIG